MPFRTRNPYYLRISEKNVLPLYLYLDERHVSWMSDNVLQHVLADLQPKILPKLKAEADAVLGSAANNKKATVDTHRGDSYQFCYFIRKTEPHSVLIKTRHFSAAPPPQKKPEVAPHPKLQGSKRKGRKADAPKAQNKRRKTKGKGKAREESDEAESSLDEGPEENGDTDLNPRRSQRAKNLVAGGYDEQGDAAPDSDVDMVDESQNERIKDETDEPWSNGTGAVDPSRGAASTPIDIDIEIEEEKPKPILTLKYKDFSIYGHCLCIVVEPYPPLRSASRAPSLAWESPRPPRAPSMAPPEPPRSAGILRARTPLFLPDDSDRERSETPGPLPPPQRILPRVPLFDEEEDGDNDSDDGGMMEFSQALNDFNHLPAGAADDDDDMDGSVFFGDADEKREL
ncbi:hypothetical protein C8J57DRAFT_738180 [Mycena rebaudengoi]|nr:hypothetical protein C8J57DRAFT_738180 [Mycena rebaudengoi]